MKRWTLYRGKMHEKTDGRYVLYMDHIEAVMLAHAASSVPAEARISELEALFALQQTRMAEATRMWQEATGKQDVLPDLGDLLAWLMARSVELEALVRRYQEKADALFRYTSAKPPKTDAMMAILTELSLEGEARAVLAKPQEGKE